MKYILETVKEFPPVGNFLVQIIRKPMDVDLQLTYTKVRRKLDFVRIGKFRNEIGLGRNEEIQVESFEYRRTFPDFPREKNSDERLSIERCNCLTRRVEFSRQVFFSAVRSRRSRFPGRDNQRIRQSELIGRRRVAVVGVEHHHPGPSLLCSFQCENQGSVSRRR